MQIYDNDTQKQGKQLPCFYRTADAGGVTLMYCDSTDSTNALAKRLLREGSISSHTAIAARRQTAGRGRYDRSFLSAEGKGVYLTLVRRIAEEETCVLTRISCYSALAACDLLRECGVENIGIKWPNDVLAGGRKICGILPESVVHRGVRYLILGIGVNIGYDRKELKELADIATSVYIETGMRFDTDVLASRLCTLASALVDSVLGEERTGADTLGARYSAMLDTIGKKVRCGENLSQCGTAVGVTHDGALVIQKDDGTEENIGWGEITRLS